MDVIVCVTPRIPVSNKELYTTVDGLFYLVQLISIFNHILYLLSNILINISHYYIIED